MSEPMAATDETREVPCPLCGVTVTQRRYTGIYVGTPWWRIVTKHRAPCGLPCFGGGATTGDGSMEAYKSGQIHGLDTKPCPRCG